MFSERDYIAVGSAPVDEECVQVGTPNYAERAQLQCSYLKKVIGDALGSPPPGVFLEVWGFCHDFGTYYEVVCSFDPDNKEAREYARLCESAAPAAWPEQIREELGL